MLYLHVIDTHNVESAPKSMFIEDAEAYKIGKLISQNEKDNLVIINEIGIDKKQRHKRTMTIIHVFLNGKEDIEYSEKLKVKRKK